MMTVPNFYRLETSRWDLSNYNDFILDAARQFKRRPSSFPALPASASR